MQTTPYLLFNGNCEEALKFYASALGGRIECVIPYEGTPAAAEAPAGYLRKVLHGRVNVNGQIIMASDCPPERYQKPQGFSLSLNVNDPAEAERLFHTLAEGGNVCMPIQETFWAQRYGIVTDRFGTPWMVNCEKTVDLPNQQKEQTHAVAR